ncbi:MAG: TRAP transporter large permease subunit [SAR116 cluster bacterium]|nr:MAG: TRAP transporter large permease subunit [SAR116 cluster bacterium]|tara:strand:- start:187 stop:885 length:699 start_codon:yes stop_codon:yes gene_type:complete
MSYELIAVLMFSSMMLMLLTGQRVFVAIGFVAVISAFLLYGTGGSELGFTASMKLMEWYPLLTLPMFVLMGYVMSESWIADDLYRMFHVWMGPLNGGLAICTIGLMVLISAMNGRSVAGMAIGATIALPELLKRGYDKLMITGVIQAGSSLGILRPPSVVLVLYTITCQIAYMTPPFGYNLFLVRAMAPPEISIIDIYRSVIPFVGVMVVMLTIMMLFPELALWLPNQVFGK